MSSFRRELFLENVHVEVRMLTYCSIYVLLVWFEFESLMDKLFRRELQVAAIVSNLLLKLEARKNFKEG